MARTKRLRSRSETRCFARPEALQVCSLHQCVRHAQVGEAEELLL